MDKKEIQRKWIKISVIILALCLVLVYILTRLFAKLETEHIVHEALDPYFLKIGKSSLNR
jgi:hypothetical protein